MLCTRSRDALVSGLFTLLVFIISGRTTEVTEPGACSTLFENGSISLSCVVHSYKKLVLDPVDLYNVSRFYVNGCGGLHFIRQLQDSFANIRQIDFSECMETTNEIKRNDFQKIAYITTLRINKYGLQSIEKESFRTLSQLIKLDLSENVLLTFTQIENGLVGFTAFGLEYFNISGTHCAEDMEHAYLDMGILEPLSRTQLKTFDVSWTRLTAARAPLSLISSVEDVRFTGIFVFGTVNCLSSVILWDKLTVVDLSVWPRMPRGLKSIIALPDPEYLQERSVDSPSLCPPIDLQSEKGCIKVPAKLHTLLLRYIDSDSLYFNFKENFCVEDNVIVNIIFSGIQLSAPMTIFTGLHALEVFDLSYPELPKSKFFSAVKNNFSADMPSLKILLIPGTRLNLLPLEVLAGLFKQNKNLTVLDISNNNLVALPLEMLIHNSKLETLDASSNKLTVFSEKHVVGNLNIKIIKLFDNKIKTLDPNLFSLLNQHGHEILVNVMSNDMQCLCWESTLSALSHVSVQYECSSDTGTRIVDSRQLGQSILPFHCHDQHTVREEYERQIGIIAGASVVIFLLIVMSVLCVLFRRRKGEFAQESPVGNELQLSDASIIQRTDVFLITLAPTTPTATRNPNFLAFLAYSYTDREIATMKIYDPLLKTIKSHTQNNASFSGVSSKMIIYDKYFLPGDPLDDLIESAVFNSWVTIVVVSDAFIDSYWCHFEVQTALASQVPIIPLYLSSCSPSKLRGALKVLYDTKVRLLWPDTAGMSEQQARRAEDAVIDKLAKSIVTHCALCKNGQ